ncbi:MAG TPA: hypothetical protein VEV45_21080 [Streptosporangiaceae bacterium]|nr:hypothetical protein [Streptosporangiaceae bacterium]
MPEIKIDNHETATAICDEGDWHGDAHDLSEVSGLMSQAAMHAIALGHTVHEHVDRDVTIHPL